MLGRAAATASKPQSTGSRNTRQSPAMTMLTSRQTKRAKTEATQYASEYTSCPQIGQGASAREGQRRKRSARPTGAPNTKYRLKGKAGIKRSVPMTCVKSLPTRFYRLKSGHAPVGTYLKRFGHREDDKYWWCSSRRLQTRGHLFRQCSRWKDQQTERLKEVGKATEWKAGRCRHVQIYQLFSIDGCDQAVMDFLVATDVRKFPSKLAEEPR